VWPDYGRGGASVLTVPDDMEPETWALYVANFWRLLPFYHGKPKASNVLYRSGATTKLQRHPPQFNFRPADSPSKEYWLSVLELSEAVSFESDPELSNSLGAGYLLMSMCVELLGADPQLLDLYVARRPLEAALTLWDNSLVTQAWIWASPAKWHTVRLPDAVLRIHENAGIDFVLTHDNPENPVGCGIRGMSILDGQSARGVGRRVIPASEVDYCNYTLTGADIELHLCEVTDAHEYPAMVVDGTLYPTNDPESLDTPIVARPVRTLLPKFSQAVSLQYQVVSHGPNVRRIVLTVVPDDVAELVCW
jgi:hypothetical protein